MNEFVSQGIFDFRCCKEDSILSGIVDEIAPFGVFFVGVAFVFDFREDQIVECN
jgi:hypothetical protein